MADGASVRAHVAGGAVIVALGVVGIGRDVRCHIGASARRVTVWLCEFEPVPKYCAWAAVAASVKAAANIICFIPSSSPLV
jgi:hypothetical protein